MKAPRLMERATKVLDHTREFAKERANHVKAFVQNRPLLTSLLGLSAGFLLGMLLAPRVPRIMVEVRSNGKVM